MRNDVPPSAPPSPARPSLEAELAAYDWSAAHRAPIQMRYSDTDAMGHLNNAVYVQYLETSRTILMKDVQVPPAERSVVARLELDYRREIKLGQQVVVETLVERLGNSSWTVVSRVLADGMVSAVARTVEVRVGEGLHPTPLSGRMREVFAPFVARPVSA